MPNTLQTHSRISSLAVDLLYRRTALVRTVARQSFTDFQGGAGDTVTVRVRSKVASRKRATANQGDTITVDNVTETGVAVTLAEIYNAIEVTNAEWELELEDFGRQILEPQIAGIAEGAEDELATAMNGIAADASFDLSASAADTKTKLIAASEALDLLDVPMTDRYLSIHPTIKSRMLEVDAFTQRDTIGSGSALERATFGDILGFTVVVSNALTSGTALAYHSSGFGFAAGARSVPSDVEGSIGEFDGLSMLWLRQWNPTRAREESFAQVFAGASAVDAGNRVYKLDTATA